MNFQISVLDDLGKEATQVFDIPTEIVTLHMKEGGKALGFGTYAGADNLVNSAWNIKAPSFIGSLGFIKNLTAGDDLNTLTTFGKYNQGTHGASYSPANVPSGHTKAFVLYVISANGTTDMNGAWRYGNQILIDLDGYPIYYRSMYTDGSSTLHFSAWNELMAPKASKDSDGLNIANSYVKRSTTVFGTHGGAEVTGWWKVASGSFTTYNNTNLCWLVRDNYNSGQWGILCLEMRGNSSSGTAVIWGLRWLVRSGFSLNHFIVTASGTSWTLYAYRSNQYGKLSFVQLQQKDILGTDINSVTYYNTSWYGTTAPSGTASVDVGLVNTANHLGSATVGAANQPIYLNAGTPTAATTVTTATSGIVTRSGGLGITSQSGSYWGRVAQLTLTLNGDGAWHNKGDNIFTGTVASGWRPKTDIMGVGYYSDMVYTGWITSGGAITIRLTGYSSGVTFTSGSPVVISWTYLW